MTEEKEMLLFDHPPLPDVWSYDASVKVMKSLIYKWKNMTRDVANELWIARENLSSQGKRTDLTSVNSDRSWGGYCEEIGIGKNTANGWLNRWFPESLTLKIKPIIQTADYNDWLPQQKDCDLLLTDPPYSTDVPDIRSFADSWLPMAINKVKPTGRAYVCIGAYPEEIAAYLAVSEGLHLRLSNILVWTYENTIGPSPTYDYKLNWQAILYYRGMDVPPLKCPQMMEQMTVQKISAPDGRQGDRYHQWQKPLELGERLIRHSTEDGALILDPFAGTGSFLLSANKLGRVAYGCDIDPVALDIAKKRGCEWIAQ